MFDCSLRCSLKSSENSTFKNEKFIESSQTTPSGNFVGRSFHFTSSKRLNSSDYNQVILEIEFHQSYFIIWWLAHLLNTDDRLNELRKSSIQCVFNSSLKTYSSRTQALNKHYNSDDLSRHAFESHIECIEHHTHKFLILDVFEYTLNIYIWLNLNV